MNSNAGSLAPVAAKAPGQSRRRFWWVFGISVLLVLTGLVWLLTIRGGPIRANPSGGGEPQAGGNLPVVDVVHPLQGGIERDCVQPGTVEPFESADLYSKVSGFLLETKDIGARVTRGEVLARIWVPEFEKQVEKDVASVERAKSQIKQMEARLLAVKAEARAAEQMIAQARVEVKSKAAYRAYRAKQLERIKELYQSTAVEAKLVDEEMDRYEAAFEAENSAKEAVTTAELKTESAKARIGQAEADVDNAKAEYHVAEAELQKAKVFLDYTVIKSPYDGVVTKRHFNRGDFIRTADSGGDRVPVLAVDRTDLMRIVVQVPDADVPYVDPGDPATVEIFALPGIQFKGKVSREADAEDPQTRTMRTEIDMPNKDGALRRNMYGRVTIVLQRGAPHAVRIPSAALVSKGSGRQGTVRIVRDGVVHLAPVEVGTDNGVEVEILHGLEPSDAVVLQSSSPVEEGSKVRVVNSSAGGSAGH